MPQMMTAAFFPKAAVTHFGGPVGVVTAKPNISVAAPRVANTPCLRLREGSSIEREQSVN